jgi:hypothetical protein
MTPRHANIARPLAEALERICAPANDSGIVRCTHCSAPAWCRGWHEGEVVQLCPACELALEYMHACRRCGDRAFAHRCAARGES